MAALSTQMLAVSAKETSISTHRRAHARRLKKAARISTAWGDQIRDFSSRACRALIRVVSAAMEATRSMTAKVDVCARKASAWTEVEPASPKTAHKFSINFFIFH